MFQAVIPAVRAIGPVARATGQVVGKTLVYASMTYSTVIVGAIAVDGATRAAKGTWKAIKFVGKAARFGREGVYGMTHFYATGELRESNF